jgi:acetyl-CoA acetyltransferase
MREAVVVASSRTPLAKSFRGSFNLTRPDDLAAHAIRDVLGKAPQLDPAEIEDVILGCGQPHGEQGHNVGRVAALRAGLPASVAGTTVNRFCSSGLQAIAMAAHAIIHEGVEAAIGGGVESISRLTRDNAPNPWVKERFPGLYMVMGETAEVVARRYGIGRQAQDEYALSSQQRTARAQAEGFFKEELAPIQVTRGILDTSTGTSATAPTRPWKDSESFRPTSIPEAATARSRPATPPSSPTGPPRPSSCLASGPSGSASGRSSSSAASRWPGARPTRWGSGRSTRCPASSPATACAWKTSTSGS